MKSNRESFYEASSPNLFNISKERDPNPADSDDPLIMNSVSKYERVTILWNTELERDSETSYTSRQNTFVNLSVSRNHLKCNIILRICMILVLVINAWVIPWMRNRDWSINSNIPWNYNPQWVYIDRNLYFYEVLSSYDNWTSNGFNGDFWHSIAFLIVSGIITWIWALLVFIFEIMAILSILNYIMDYKIGWFKVSFFQRYNYVFIIVTLLVWFWCQRAWNHLKGLSYGFYIMIGLVLWCWLLKFYYRYYESKLYRRRIVNQLLVD